MGEVFDVLGSNLEDSLKIDIALKMFLTKSQLWLFAIACAEETNRYEQPNPEWGISKILKDAKKCAMGDQSISYAVLQERAFDTFEKFRTHGVIDVHLESMMSAVLAGGEHSDQHADLAATYMALSIPSSQRRHTDSRQVKILRAVLKQDKPNKEAI